MVWCSFCSASVGTTARIDPRTPSSRGSVSHTQLRNCAQRWVVENVALVIVLVHPTATAPHNHGLQVQGLRPGHTLSRPAFSPCRARPKNARRATSLTPVPIILSRRAWHCKSSLQRNSVKPGSKSQRSVFSATGTSRRPLRLCTAE